MSRLVVVFLLLLSSKPKAQSNGSEIIKQSEVATSNLKSVSYNAFVQKGREKITCDVVIKTTSTLPFIKMAGLAITEHGTFQIDFVSNGSKVEYTDSKTGKTVQSTDTAQAYFSDMSSISYQNMLAECYANPDFFQSIQASAYVKDTSIYENECYVISLVTVSNNNFDLDNHSTLYIGKKDYLVRGIASRDHKQMIRIKSTDIQYDNSFFSLANTHREIKKIDGSEPSTDGLLLVGAKAPSWQLTSTLSKTIDLKKLKGQVVVLDFWGTWCIPCIRAMPDIQALHDHFKNAAVEVIGISVELNKSADPAGFVKKNNFTYTIALNGNSVAEKYRVAIFPTLYIIGKDGRIVHAEHSGGRANFKDDLIARINKALGK